MRKGFAEFNAGRHRPAAAAFRAALRAGEPEAALWLAHALQSAGDPLGAHRALRRHRVPADERSRELSKALARDFAARLGALFNAGRFKEAGRAAASVLREAPASVEALLVAGQCRLKRGDDAGALKDFSRVAELAPLEARVYAPLGRLLFRLGRLPEALSLHDRAARMGGGPEFEAAVASSLGRLLAAVERWDDALAALKKAERLRPGDPKVLDALGDVLTRLGRAREAAAAFAAADAAVAAVPVSAPEEAARAAARLRSSLLQGRLPDAVRWAGVLEGRPLTQAVADALVGPLEAEGRGRGVPASDALRRALAQAAPAGEPPRWRRYWRAYLLRMDDRRDEALRELDGLGTLSGPGVWMGYVRGRLRLAAGGHRAAERELAAVGRGAPALWKAGFCRAEALLCLGRRREAFAVMARALRGLSGVEAAQALAWRAELRLWVGDARGAEADAGRGARGWARYALCWHGAAAAVLGRPRAAVERLDGALASMPDDPEALTWRGEAKRRLGDFSGARRDLDAALALEADCFWARANRAALHAVLGDAAALRRDLDALPFEVRAWFDAHATLDAGLRAAKGMRRTEEYLYPLWLGRKPG